ncbi:hypothetical protein PVL29_009208 [Vitis rotundifolia]|uniref:Trichome birefringence-like C-terminal domain-containing protein n=1 Tax=Vitis rotundifolia TaxID=103349 RepID=A0AA38ZXU7_VITRO|nr:hypothetical protein PVL29_009208 [Vitis rotundifolia]
MVATSSNHSKILVIHEANHECDYDLSVMLFHSQYLVDIENEQNGRILKLDSLKNGEIWKNIDVLVFNTWLWWYRAGLKQS